MIRDRNTKIYSIAFLIVMIAVVGIVVMMAKKQNSMTSTTTSPMLVQTVSARNATDPMRYADMVKREYTPSPGSRPTPYTNILSALPVSDMNSSVGDIDQPIMYDRAIYSNQKSKLRGGADWIRGDLAIAPVETGWFRPSVKPYRDLNAGAMFVISGTDNSNSKRLAQLMSSSSGGKLTTFGGINYTTSLSGATGDLEIESDCPRNTMTSIPSCSC